MKKFYIICGVFCFCFLCVGLYFLISPNFSNPANSGTQGEETGGQEENQDEIVYYLGVDYAEINVFLDETAEIKYKILPVDAVPEIKIEDENILNVENFVITPKKVGSTKLTLTHKNTTKEIIVNVIEKEINFNFSINNFISGKNQSENYIDYIINIKYNFNYINKELKLSNNIQIINEEILNNEIILTFNILNGTSFTFDITLDDINLSKTLPCEEFKVEDETEPDDTKPDDSDDTTPEEPDIEQPEENAYYELYYNGEKITSTLYYTFKENQSNIIILDYKVFNAKGEEIEFNSSIKLLDKNNITKNQIINDYKFLTIPLFATGEIEITLTSNVGNAAISFRIVVI